MVKYEDIKEGAIYYEKHHQVRITGKIMTPLNPFQLDKLTPCLEIEYINQPCHWSPRLVGSGNLREEPLHCYNCKTELIDEIKLSVCSVCGKLFCPSCNACHCGTTWDPNKK